MRIVLSDREIARAIAVYIGAKTGRTDGGRGLGVTIQWRARKAIVDARRAVPTLTDVVRRGPNYNDEDHTA